MKIKLELFGASRDFSDNDHLEIEVQNQSSIKNYQVLILPIIQTQIGTR